MYLVGTIPVEAFQPRLELIAYLDGNLSSNGLDNPFLDVHPSAYYMPWWNNQQPPTTRSRFLSLETLKKALEVYHQQLRAKMIPFGTPHFINDITNELNKPAYTWHSSVNDDFPNPLNIVPDADYIVQLHSGSWTTFVICTTWSMHVRWPTRLRRLQQFGELLVSMNCLKLC